MTLALSKVSKALYMCMYLATQFYEATLYPKQVTHKTETVQWFSSDSCLPRNIPTWCFGEKQHAPLVAAHGCSITNGRKRLGFQIFFLLPLPDKWYNL